MTTFDYPDAPPLDDRDVPFERVPGNPGPDAVAISIALNRNTAALEKLAGAIEKLAATGPVQAPTAPAFAAPAAPVVDTESQVKRGKKIFAICKSQTPEWDVKATGERVTGHAMHWNSQQWAEADQIAVLDAFKEAGIG